MEYLAYVGILSATSDGMFLRTDIQQPTGTLLNPENGIQSHKAYYSSPIVNNRNTTVNPIHCLKCHKPLDAFKCPCGWQRTIWDNHSGWVITKITANINKISGLDVNWQSVPQGCLVTTTGEEL